MQMEVRAVTEGNRQVELSFSSEEPVKRWFGQEILAHDAGAVDLTRLMDVGSVLFNHGRDPKIGKMPVGKIVKAWVDEAQKKGRAIVEFDEDENSELLYQKVLGGSVKGVSCGYSVDVWEEVQPGKTSTNGRFIGPCDIAVRWSPVEISFEPTPADPSVGVGRSIEDDMPDTRQNGHEEQNSKVSIAERQLQINKNLL